MFEKRHTFNHGGTESTEKIVLNFAFSVLFVVK